MSVCVRVCEGGWGVCLCLMMHFHEEKDLHLKFERSGNSNKIHSSSCEKAFMRVHRVCRVCRVCPHAGTTSLPAAPSVVLVQFSSLSLFSSSSPVLVLVAAAAEELAMVCGARCSAHDQVSTVHCVTLCDRWRLMSSNASALVTVCMSSQAEGTSGNAAHPGSAGPDVIVSRSAVEAGVG